MRMPYDRTVFIIGVLLTYVSARQPLTKVAPESQMPAPHEVRARDQRSETYKFHRSAFGSASEFSRPITSPANYSVAINGTKPSESWSFNIESGNKGQQVGLWSANVTRDGIANALHDRCGMKRGRNPSSCDGKVAKFYAEYAGEYDVQQESKDAVHMTISSSHLPTEYGPALRNAFIDQVAETFMLAILEANNCYMFDPKSTICLFCEDKLCVAISGEFKYAKVNPQQRLVRWCNAPDYVRVAVTDPTGKEQAHMRVDLQFKCPIDFARSHCRVGLGRFDCMALVGTVGREARGNGTRIEMLKNATKGNEFDVVAACPNEEVTGSCPNEQCLYRLGACFKK
jgi:hypothetical protein